MNTIETTTATTETSVAASTSTLENRTTGGTSYTSPTTGATPRGLSSAPPPPPPLVEQCAPLRQVFPIGHSGSDPRSPITIENSVLLPGQIGLANETRFNAAFFSEPLTEYAAGWREPNDLEALLDFVAPPVQVGRRFEYKRADNAEAFLLDTDDYRAIGATFKHVEYRGSSVNEKTLNRGLAIRVDLDAVGDTPDWREMFTTRLLQRLVRNELKRAIDLLVASATNVPKTWDTTVGKDPDQDILNELIAANDAAGIRPNRVLFGDVAWNKRLVSHRAQATAGGFASAALSLNDLASHLLVDGVRISRERYQSSAAAKSKITPDIVLMFFGMDRASTEDPTSAKRFWSPVDGGGRFRVYEQQVSAKLVDLTVEYYSNLVLTSSVGLRKLTIS